MKIDFIIDSFNGGGAQRVMSTLANGFAHKKKEVNLITFNDGDAYKLEKEVRRTKLHSGNISNHTLRACFNLLKFYRVKNNRPHVIISFMPSTNFVAILIGKLYGLKVIVSEHNNHLANKSFKSTWIRNIFYRFADAVTILTKFDLEHFKALGAKVTVMANPIVLPNLINDFNSRKKNILVVGSLVRYQVKGFDKLLPLIKPILLDNPNWTLTIAGSGEPGMTELVKLCNELNLNDRVLFTGFCDNIEELMQNSQIFILGSQYEGLPMVLMEALSNGMSCIAYDCISGPSDLITDKENGLLIENQNEKLMQDGIEKLIVDEKLRTTLAKKAVSSVNKYSVENIMCQWEDLIMKIN